MDARLSRPSFLYTNQMTGRLTPDCSELGSWRSLTRTIQTTKIRDGLSQSPRTRIFTTSNGEPWEQKGDSWPKRDSRESGLACLLTLRETQAIREGQPGDSFPQRGLGEGADQGRFTAALAPGR